MNLVIPINEIDVDEQIVEKSETTEKRQVVISWFEDRPPFTRQYLTVNRTYSVRYFFGIRISRSLVSTECVEGLTFN